MKPLEVKDKRVTVVGAGISGVGAARLLAEAGAEVFLSERGSISPVVEQELRMAGVDAETDGHTTRAQGADFFVVSPGAPSTAPVIQEAQQNGTPVFSEIEVASWFCEAPVVAITGTNGKTTTTSLLGHIFRNAGRKTVVAGNIGHAFSDAVREEVPPEAVVVLEVSSFQLDHIDTFRPVVSVLLNITPDHLDRYGGDMDGYAHSKYRIFENQRGNDMLVYNYDDSLLRKHVTAASTHRDLRSVAFSYKEALEDGAWLRDGSIVVRIRHQEEVLMSTWELALRGQHNLYNSMAAAVAARTMDVRCDSIRESLARFEGVPHRLEFVRELAGVRYVNDSKATNVNALWYALESFGTQIILIAGGRDKGNDYSGLQTIVRQKVRATIGFGESADTVKKELGAFSEQALAVRTLEEATQCARLVARPGDVVLLSPACSSFDLFESYAHRGDVFRRLVRSL